VATTLVAIAYDDVFGAASSSAIRTRSGSDALSSCASPDLDRLRYSVIVSLT
jgi:hypothetical protein